MPSPTPVNAWRENQACVATYTVLESDKFLDQFEQLDVPFDKAATLAMKELRYFPSTTNNSSLLAVLSLEIARKFVKHLISIFTVRRQHSAGSSAEVIQAIAQVFANGDKTLVDLAAVVDEQIKFPDEH
ncbi:hypothetical protein SAMN05660964_01143 [Thiothrix caldifontis]|jgi:hypothetical protein|uniref:Uncharacterized protein n=1 Tax=Thiothrix caldifontis TaxID=525918 RepID=A0A1H3ZEU9_9GAMM|nr:hypothetical protein [Thiothrix caldifontis]SEA21832.1 hypothetical protein SAMN05660964_01143 [Thiothrix caldifontis]